MSSWKRSLHAVESRFDALKRRWYAWRGRTEPIRVLPFRGYAAGGVLHMKGRVLEKEHEPPDEGDSLWQNLARMYRRYESDEIPGARVLASFRDQEMESEADVEGYFELEWALGELGGLGPGLWHRIELELLAPRVEEPPRVSGEFIRPTAEASFAVVSDVDDTIIRTAATDLLRMVRIVALGNARTRVPFPGVAAFYRALSNGSSGAPRNPIFYVSSSPWNLYDLFVHFLDHHDIPKGPFFLKDFGIDENKFIKSGHGSHKLERVERLLDAFPGLPFLLIGDSGQRDPEIYHELASRHPDRILGVYLRHVAGDARREEVRRLLDEIEAKGIPARIASETETLAKHAIEQGWIPERTLSEIHADRTEDESSTEREGQELSR